MTREEAINWLDRLYIGADITDEYGDMENVQPYEEALNIAIKALEQASILDKIKAEIEMYEADCRLQGGTDECEKCNSNVFGSIYRIIDKYKAESEV